MAFVLTLANKNPGVNKVAKIVRESAEKYYNKKKPADSSLEPSVEDLSKTNSCSNLPEMLSVPTERTLSASAPNSPMVKKRVRTGLKALDRRNSVLGVRGDLSFKALR